MSGSERNSILFHIWCLLIPAPLWKKLWNWQNISGILAICRNRYRISIQHHLRFPPACITPDWIRALWRKCTSPTIRMRKPCNVPSYSTAIRKTMIWYMKRCIWLTARISLGLNQNAWSGQNIMDNRIVIIRTMDAIMEPELHIRKSGKQSVTCTRKNRNNWIFQATKWYIL